MLGTFGAGGVLIVVVLALIAHKRGGGKFQPVKGHHVFYWGAVIGIVAAGAGQSLQKISLVGTQFSDTLTKQSETFGTIGPAAVAAFLVGVAFWFKPSFVKDLICGIAAPGVLSAASGIWAIFASIGTSLVHTVVS
ncbi:hypothetical protein [Kitasatospora cathayae]|uniref:Uncharacterized protein n=1 Tax=Kitasatospora cathayae TaxID=3004092 RepID=A0ABY7QAF1_9ACTN|nr:hypothetical protein [Kitasatospora sp. HUAS 3-15]WBP89516.1 hypothetical protein O1G21_29195 [Kitasatospora sp. HUAS 3-15]